MEGSIVKCSTQVGECMQPFVLLLHSVLVPGHSARSADKAGGGIDHGVQDSWILPSSSHRPRSQPYSNSRNLNTELWIRLTIANAEIRTFPLPPIGLLPFTVSRSVRFVASSLLLDET